MPPSQKNLKSRSSDTLFSAFFRRHFFRKSNFVQLGIIFSPERNLFFSFGLQSRRGKCLVLPLASYGPEKTVRLANLSAS